MDQNVIHQKKALRYVVAHEQIKEFIQKAMSQQTVDK